MKRGEKKELLIIFFIFVLAVLILLSVLIAENSESALSTEWRMFGRNLNHTAWDGVSFTVIPGLNYSIFITGGIISASSPTVANGYVYIGGEDFGVYQLNASNISQKIANFTTGGIIQSSPAVANGYVYIGSNDYQTYQLNASNISQKIANFTTGRTVRSSPAVANGYVYIGNFDNNNIYQLNASNISQKIANFTTGGTISSSPAVANGYVYIGSSSGATIYQLNATNISIQIANYVTGSNVVSSPAVANGYVYIGSLDNRVYQLNATNISIQFANFTTGGGFTSSPAVANGYVYIGSRDKNIYQLNATNISIQFANFTTGNLIDYSSPAVANGYVYIGSYDKNIYQLNASNISQKIANYTTGNWIESSPAVANGYVYIGSYDWKIYQLNASNINIITNDTIPPMVSIFGPTASTYSGNIGILIMLNELGYCEYSLNKGITNNTLEKLSNGIWFSGSISLPDGNYVLNAYCNDTAGNRNDLVSVSFSVVNSSIQELPSGTGTVTPLGEPPAQTYSWNTITSGQPALMTVNDPNSGIVNISITTTVNVSSASLVLQQILNLTSVDFEIGTRGVIYQVFSINSTNLNSSNLAAAIIGFRVNKTWMQQNSIKVNRIYLYRRPTDSTTWSRLLTTGTGQDVDYDYYSALSPGFSTFLVFSDLGDCIPTQMRCFNSQVQYCAENSTWAVREQCIFGCENGSCNKSLFSYWYYITGLVVILGIIIFVYIKIRKKSK